MPDEVYLTAAEWQAMVTGIDLSGLTDAEQDEIIARASLLANTYISNATLLETEYVNEQHYYRPHSRRVYLYNWPVSSLEAVRLRVAPGTTATVDTDDVYVNQNGRYIEIASMTLSVGLVPDVLQFGMAEIEVEVDYTAGYATIPDDVKMAVAIIAAALYVAKSMFEEGTFGIRSFTIGSYQVSVSTKDGQPAGFDNYIPEPAKILLDAYKFTVLR